MEGSKLYDCNNASLQSPFSSVGCCLLLRREYRNTGATYRSSSRDHRCTDVRGDLVPYRFNGIELSEVKGQKYFD